MVISIVDAEFRFRSELKNIMTKFTLIKKKLWYNMSCNSYISYFDHGVIKCLRI